MREAIACSLHLFHFCSFLTRRPFKGSLFLLCPLSFFSFCFILASTSLSFRSIEMKQKEKNTITQPLFPSLISCAFPLCFAPFQWTEWKKRTREARKERKTKNKSTENNPLLFLVLLVLCEESTHYIIFHLSLFTYSTKKNKARSDRKEPKLKGTRNQRR